MPDGTSGRTIHMSGNARTSALIAHNPSPTDAATVRSHAACGSPQLYEKLTPLLTPLDGNENGPIAEVTMEPRVRRMERRGFEPLTPWLQSGWSTNELRHFVVLTRRS